MNKILHNLLLLSLAPSFCFIITNNKQYYVLISRNQSVICGKHVNRYTARVNGWESCLAQKGGPEKEEKGGKNQLK